MEPKSYDAFISYSHQDLKWGKWLQKRLENYRIPAEFRKDGKHLHIFRDQTDLAGVELHSSLQRALEASRYLIVLCSPASAKSPWVDEEIRTFRDLGGAERIIPFIVGGEPESDDPDRECFPEALRSLEDMELLGINIQEIGKSKATLKLISVLLDVRLNRLADRDRQRRLRTGLIAGASGLIAVFFAAGMIWRNVEISRRNRDLTYDNYAAALLELKQEDFTGEDVEHLRASAEVGNSEAMVLLADCCIHGWGMPEDREEAFSWMMRAAEAGNTKAMTWLTDYYLNGIGTEQNMQEGFIWSLRAAEEGIAEAMWTTAQLYYGGIGTEPNPEKAFEWYQKAAENGHVQAAQQLGWCYFLGIGTEPDSAKGLEAIRKAAEAGDPLSMRSLGMLYREGLVTAEDPEQAYYWFRQSALAGDADGMYETGWCIEHRYGVQNPAQAWYDAAMAAGSQQALAALQGRKTESPEAASDQVGQEE